MTSYRQKFKKLQLVTVPSSLKLRCLSLKILTSIKLIFEVTTQI